MPKIVALKECSGCHACFSACPWNCIDMTENNEGFLYPVINTEKCVNCGICEKVCQVISKEEIDKAKPTAYACYNKNESIRLKSSSGGIFTLLAESVLDLGGVVFGAAFDEELNVVHKCIDNKEDLEKLRGSKYVQSTIGNTYIQTKELLDSGRMILFSGTPCQIDGLLNFLEKDYENLYTQDLICHGVPSSKVWREYLKYMQEKENSQIKNVYFRNKKYGWKNYATLIEYDSGAEYINQHTKDLFGKSFLKNLSLRNSCFECRSKSLNRRSDITLADFWGVECIVPDMDDDKGTSLVMVNSLKGQKLFGNVFENVICKEVDLEKAVGFNSCAYKSTIHNKKRNKFFKMLGTESFDIVIKKCAKRNVLDKISGKILRVLKKLKRRVCKYVQK